jgi:hypothetical protein
MQHGHGRIEVRRCIEALVVRIDFAAGKDKSAAQCSRCAMPLEHEHFGPGRGIAQQD